MSAVGTSCSALQGTASTAGSAQRGQVRLPDAGADGDLLVVFKSGSPRRTAAARSSAASASSRSAAARAARIAAGIVAEIVREIERRRGDSARASAAARFPSPLAQFRGRQ